MHAIWKTYLASVYLTTFKYILTTAQNCTGTTETTCVLQPTPTNSPVAESEIPFGGILAGVTVLTVAIIAILIVVINILICIYKKSAGTRAYSLKKKRIKKGLYELQEQNLQIDDIFVSDKNKKLTMNDIIASYNTTSTEKLNVKDTDEGLKPEGLMKGMIHSFTGDRGLEPASLLKGVTGEEGIKSTGFIQKSMVTTFTGEQGSGLMKSITDTVTGNEGLKLEPASFVKGITGEEGIKSTGFIQKSMVTTLTGHGEQGSSLMKSITDTVTGNEGLKLEPGITGEEGIKSTGFIQKSMVTTFTGEQGSSLMKSITDSITSNEGLKLEPASFVKSVTSEEGTDFIQKSMVTTFTGEQGSSLMKSITDTVTGNEGLKLEPASFVKGITGEEGIKSTGFIEKSMVTTLTGHGEQGSRLMKSIADTVIGNEGLKLEPASFVKSVTGEEGLKSTGFIQKSMVTTLTGHGEQGSSLMKSIADTVTGNEGLKLEPASFVKSVTGEESTGFMKSVSDTFAGGEGLKLEAGSLVKDVMDTFTHNYELNLQATTAAVTSTSVEENKPKYELNVQPKANENVMTANVQSNDDYDEVSIHSLALHYASSSSSSGEDDIEII